MEYLDQPLGFGLRKALRYIRLYGVRRTLVKVESYLHMRHRLPDFPRPPAPRPESQHVGLLGCGKFGFAAIAWYLRRHAGPVLRGVMDLDAKRAASLARCYRAAWSTTDARRVLDDPGIDLVFIASDHASHADYAVAALQAGKSVHIEKPHVVDEDQLVRLCRAMTASQGWVRLGFNRPESPFGRRIREQLAGEPGPIMMSFFVAGHEIEEGHWYMGREQGGRVLGNLCHWTDFCYQVMPPERRYPITIRPTRAARADCDFVVTYTFGDGSIAAIAFSEKGEPFEGVRERFSAHRGRSLIAMDDFERMTIDVGDRKRSFRLRHRDHGHEAMVLASYGLSGRSRARREGASVDYVWETGELFLATKLALEEDREVKVQAFAKERCDRAPRS